MPTEFIFRQRGQATIEYLYVLPILLLLFLGSLQIVFIYEAKQTLNYATFVATRAGALNKGSMSSIQAGLASGLAPLFSHDVGLTALRDARHLASCSAREGLYKVLCPHSALYCVWVYTFKFPHLTGLSTMTCTRHLSVSPTKLIPSSIGISVVAVSFEKPKAMIRGIQFSFTFNARKPWPMKVPNIPSRKIHSVIFIPRIIQSGFKVGRIRLIKKAHLIYW